MNNLQKGVLTVNGNDLHMSMSFSKVNKDKRTVSGYATLNNVDTQGDVVLAEASAKAFSRARGNLREMHKKDSAVGRIIDFREKTVFNKGEEYQGIYVTARVSEGAQDTWLKVLDGTLSGFSIGGEINKASNTFNKDAGKEVRVIEDYDLVELSLVDNPANQLANIDSFEKNIFTMNKAADGSVKSITGMIAETQLENVFICSADETVIIENSESEDCPICGTKMENAGWFENGPGRTEKVKDIVNKFLSPNETEGTPKERGVEMTKDNTTQAPEPESTTPPTDSPDEVHVSNTESSFEGDETGGSEDIGSVNEVVDDEAEISKKIDELHVAVKDSLEKSREETSSSVQALAERINDISKALETKTSQLEEKLNQLGNNLEATKSRLSGFEKSLDTINKSDAIRKSADVESEESTQKTTGLWNGTFSGTDLFR